MKKKCWRSKTLTKIRNAIDDLISRLDIAEERISELEDTTIKTFKSEKAKRKIKTDPPAQYIQDLQEN